MTEPGNPRRRDSSTSTPNKKVFLGGDAILQQDWIAAGTVLNAIYTMSPEDATEALLLVRKMLNTKHASYEHQAKRQTVHISHSSTTHRAFD